jgi:diguanylate cyclase
VAVSETNDGDRQLVETLSELLADREQWLMRRVLGYARELGFAAYTSTLEEAWRVSIQGLSASLIESVEAHGFDDEIRADDDPSSDPCAAFGIQEADQHRSRGIGLGMFIGLMKYYRESYLDLADLFVKGPSRALFKHAIHRFFDRIEIAFSERWAEVDEGGRLEELKNANRRLTNSKNKYLTLFESLEIPVFLLDQDQKIENMNDSASRAFGFEGPSGSSYYSSLHVGRKLEMVESEIADFFDLCLPEVVIERMLETVDGPRYFDVRLKRMLDVSGKFAGSTVTFTDVTLRKLNEERFRDLSLRDPLTGLYNRRGLEALGRAHLLERRDSWVYLVYVDLDNLKIINDEHGHPVGDGALVALADVLREAFRDQDVIARVGGDEFAVLVITDKPSRQTALLARLGVAIRQANAGGSLPFTMSVSAGVACCDRRETDCDLMRLVSEADREMYERKHANRRRRLTDDAVKKRAGGPLGGGL